MKQTHNNGIVYIGQTISSWKTQPVLFSRNRAWPSLIRHIESIRRLNIRGRVELSRTLMLLLHFWLRRTRFWFSCYITARRFNSYELEIRRYHVCQYHVWHWLVLFCHVLQFQFPRLLSAAVVSCIFHPRNFIRVIFMSCIFLSYIFSPSCQVWIAYTFPLKIMTYVALWLRPLTFRSQS